LFLLIVFSAVPVLFAAGPSMPAVVLEIYLLGRIVIEGTFAGHRAGMFADSDPDTLDPEVTLRCMRTAIRCAGFGLVTILFATTWVAAGTAPSWAERTILTALWIIVSALLISRGRGWRNSR
jgi:hypothetical protein